MKSHEQREEYKVKGENVFFADRSKYENMNENHFFADKVEK